MGRRMRQKSCAPASHVEKSQRADTQIFRKTENLPPPFQHARRRPDSPPQITRFSVSRAVSPPASLPPSRGKRRHFGPISSTSLAGRSFRFSIFQIFGAAKAKLLEHVGSYRNHHRGDTRENPFRFGHFGIGQFRFGTGSGSGQVRAALICCTSWVYIMCRVVSTAKFG